VATTAAWEAVGIRIGITRTVVESTVGKEITTAEAVAVERTVVEVTVAVGSGATIVVTEAVVPAETAAREVIMVAGTATLSGNPRWASRTRTSL
jgi:hypothetical protein